MANKKSAKKKKKDTPQYHFEDAVKKMKSDVDKLKLSFTSDWNYGTDPQKKNSKLGKRKSLPRLCSYFIRKYISEWIPSACRLNYCVMSKGINKICCDEFNLQQYTFGAWLNISSLIQQRFKCDINIASNDQRMITRALMREIIDEKTTNCKLKVNVNKQYESLFYLKRIKQDRLAKSMDIAQNDYRMSYAPDILIDIGSDNHGILMRLRCKESCVGVGFWNLVKWKSNTTKNNTGINPFEESTHSMIHICDSFDIMSKVDISFGFKQNVCIDSISIEVIGTHLTECNGKIVLYQWEKEQNYCSNNSVDKHQLMPTIGNLSSCNNNSNINKKRDFNELTVDSAVPATKKRKLN